MNHSVAGIAVNADTVFVGLRSPSGDMGSRWEFPGGKVEDGETYEQSLIREFNEEFACPVTVGRKLDVQYFTHNGIEFALHAYEITLLQKPVVNSDEHSACDWKTMQEIAAVPFVDSDKKLFAAVMRYMTNRGLYE